ncbi:MAG: peptidoglycan DD-metalloendopeptidase family protein [Saprospiraceae bacterium]|nr:peptidoglycan DD-metalloendopeptidase family protein [Candidatus Brachybacter algidus]MBK7602099.1 peptidoglycan DD-metalloendopeptidase family protein [Candidatus Brachybacter algidus]MBK9025208.1 peptidoglycan DD-metalloendopeptidase family protein [Candidatus Brachybacter algidus]MBK9552990.1 peptidoglycan DD-metalloendopeptidase family protein [Candidatus Brachybacter algidus]HQW71496.1 peptidoglycan DD-metalloendopeptidase family protein [Saprospiraceae bacterium]
MSRKLLYIFFGAIAFLVFTFIIINLFQTKEGLTSNSLKVNKTEDKISEETIVPNVYQVDLKNFMVKLILLEEKMKIGDILDSVQIHATKKAAIKRIIDEDKIYPDGTKVLLLSEKNYPDIPVYIIIESDPKDYEIISIKETIPRISKYPRQLSVILKKKRILIGKDAIKSFIDQSHEDLLSKVENVLAWKIDMNRIDSGNIIKVAYEELYFKKAFMGIGKLLALEWIHRDTIFKAYLIPGKFDETGKEVYCTAEGLPLKESFRKSPVNYGRISSRFSPRRFHPKLKYFKAHKGTDFAAPEGSPLFAIGDGKITVASFTSNNGNFIKIQHDKIYTTQYLHLSKFKKGIHAGMAVRQGDVIGYVGQTGLATGPHVCLRLWKNNEQVDFLKEKFPLSAHIQPFEIELFRNVREYYSNYLQSLNN